MENIKSQYFVDEKVTCLRAGKGGDGLVSFMHLKGNEFAGPDGGDGGNGGHILFKGNLPRHKIYYKYKLA